MLPKYSKLQLALYCLAFSDLAFAGYMMHPLEAFPWPPRLTLEVTSGGSTFGAADAMLPIVGGENLNLYVDVGGKYGDDSARLGNVGIGLRNVWRNMIFGGYFFSDYNRTPDEHHFNVLNPGLEFMTPLWDGRINGYFPRGNRRVNLELLTGSQLGRPHSIYFNGHQQFEKLFDRIEEVGSGADVQLGYTAPNLAWTRVFAGGYHFSPKYTPVVNGVAVGFEAPLKFDWAQLKVQDSYDNLEGNTFVVSLQLTLGGLNKVGSFDVHNRMLDLIPRHIANLSNGDGIPDQKKIINRGKINLLDTNIWFFNQDGASFGDVNPVTTLGSCTAEHPCIGLSQSRIDAINNIAPNAKLYLSSGTYNNPDVGNAFSLRNGQSIYGRFPGFMVPAVGNMRPLLNDSLFLEGNNQVYNITVQGQSMRSLSTGGQMFPFQVGVLLRSFAGGDAKIFNSDFSVTSDTNNVVAAANNSNNFTLNLIGNNLSATTTNILQGVTIGAANLRMGNLNILNSSITTQSSNTTKQFSVTFGVVNNESGLVNIKNSAIAVTANNGVLSAGVLNNSTLGLGLGTINIYQSSISNVTDNIDLSIGVLNQANNFVGKSAPVNIIQSNIFVVSSNHDNPFSSTAGIAASGDGQVSINTSNINANTTSGFVFGISNSDPTTTVNFVNSVIAANTSGVAFGAPIFATGTFNDLGGNICLLDGVVVPCLT